VHCPFKNPINKNRFRRTLTFSCEYHFQQNAGSDLAAYHPYHYTVRQTPGFPGPGPLTLLKQKYIQPCYQHTIPTITTRAPANDAIAPNPTLSVLLAPECVEGPLVPKGVVPELVAEMPGPRSNVGVPVWILVPLALAVALALAGPPTGAVKLPATVVATATVAVVLTPGRPVPDGIGMTLLSVTLSFAWASAII
jgi:hypothetical protein